MIHRWEVESIFDDLKSGRIDEYDAKSALQRLDNSRCVQPEIDRLIRDSDYKDSFDCAREFEDASRRCEIQRNREREDREREEREYYGW